MKKLLSFTLLTIITTMGLPSIQAQEDFACNVRQEAAKQSPYANQRAAQMCGNWPNCAQWASTRVQQNSSFRIVDAEREYWIAGWGRKGAVWFQNLYLQTQENGQKLTYQFMKNMNGYEPEPYQINKFPGHPPVSPAVKTSSSALEQCAQFPNCAKWHKNHKNVAFEDAAIAQFISRFDTKGNPVWNRNLYVWAYSNAWDRKQHLLFHAFQKEAGDPWTYQANPRSF